MWFAKWFERAEPDEEPSAVAPPRPTASTPASRSAAPRTVPAKPAKGFDPYNSGAFETRSAWERISRR